MQRPLSKAAKFRLYNKQTKQENASRSILFSPNYQLLFDSTWQSFRIDEVDLCLNDQDQYEDVMLRRLILVSLQGHFRMAKLNVEHSGENLPPITVVAIVFAFGR